MMKRIGIFLMLVLMGPGAGLARAEPISVEHAQGTTTLEKVPETVMVTDWAAFDNLTALGIKVAGVPSSAMPTYLANDVPDDLPRIGSLQEPDIEAIAAAEPDLVILAARSRTAYPTLAGLAPTIDMTVDNSDIVGGVKRNLERYGRIFGVEARSAELAAALDAKVAAARAAAAGRGTGLVIVTNAGRIGVYGTGSRVAWIYDALGVPSVLGDVDDRDHGGDAVSFEFLADKNPDWLFVVDRDAGIGNEGAARQLLDNELIRAATFWSKKQIVYLDPQAAYITMHGYRGLMLLLDQVTAAYRGAS